MNPKFISSLMDKKVQVKTIDNLIYIGILKGVDQNLNIVLEKVFIRTFTLNKKFKDEVEDDLWIKGDNVLYLSEINLNKENNLILSSI